jgi:hypothetical protein
MRAKIFLNSTKFNRNVTLFSLRLSIGQGLPILTTLIATRGADAQSEAILMPIFLVNDRSKVPYVGTTFKRQ